MPLEMPPPKKWLRLYTGQRFQNRNTKHNQKPKRGY